jgi:protein MpaA
VPGEVEIRRRALLSIALVLAAAAAVFTVFQSASPPEPPARTAAPIARARPESVVRRKVALGRSVRRRPIDAVALGDPDARRRLLVVGAIHGNEPAGIAITRDLTTDPPPRSGLIWTVGDLNPDGVAANTRQNAHGVDLNRNFPWHWRALQPRGGLEYSGPRSLSEPESRLAHSLILRVRPRITIWFHQPLSVVDESGGSLRIERSFARLVDLPLRRLTRYPGSAASWQDHRLPGTTAFVVELPPGRPSPGLVEHASDGIRTLLRRFG